MRTRIRYLRATGRAERRLYYGIAGLLLLGLLWVGATALLAKRQQSQLEGQLSRVQYLVAAGRVDEAAAAADEVPGMVRRARLLTSGPAWWTAAHVPWLGRPFEIARGTTAAGERIGTEVVPELIRVATTLDPNKLRTGGDTVDLRPLIAAQPALEKSSADLQRAIVTLDRLPLTSWLGPLDRARIRLELQLRSVGGYVQAAARAADVLPEMMGADGRTRRYFIGLQNEAEMRGTGGLPGAFAVVTVRNGRITFTHFESDLRLLPVPQKQLIPTGLDFGADYDRAYGSTSPTSFFTNSNISPHFPYAAQVWAAMWQKASGERVDGAMALDPQVLADLLAATGPVRLPDGSVLTADNVVSLTEKDNYAIFSNNFQRKEYLVSILRGVSTELTSGKGSAVRLARAISDASQQRRMLVWVRDPRIQKIVEQTNYSGALPRGDVPFAGLVLNNAASGKLDYYLAREIDYHRSGCGPQRDVTVTITLTNNAPAAGLPSYVTDRLDKPPFPTKPGDNRTILDYYATPGAQLLSATLNGEPTTLAVEKSYGHPIFRRELELPRGTTQTLFLHLIEPAGTGSPQLWSQPGVTPLQIRSFSQRCD